MLENRAEPQLLTASEVEPRDVPDVELLLVSHAEKAVRIAQRILRGDRATAEDVAQDAFAKAFVALPRFRGEAEDSHHQLVYVGVRESSSDDSLPESRSRRKKQRLHVWRAVVESVVPASVAIGSAVEVRVRSN